ncbi:MAG: anti-sigma factor [Gemmatimonadales bacterium]
MSHVDDGALHAYLDGELPSTERAALEAHVAGCPDCRARLTEERALVERASVLLGLAQPAERPAPPLHQLRQPRLMWRLRLPLAWAASVVLALGVGYSLHGPSSTAIPHAASPAVAREEDRPATRAPEDKAPASLGRQEFSRTNRPSDGLTSGVEAKAAMRQQAQPQPRDAAPPAVAAAPPSVTVAESPPSAAADLSALRGRLVATEWPIIRREPARRILGSEPVGVPGLAVRVIRRSPAGDGTVLVEQQLDSATVIQLFQRPATADVAGYAAPAPMRYDRQAAGLRERENADRLARFVGPLRVEIAGPLSQDSLNRLLEQVKPLP